MIDTETKQVIPRCSLRNSIFQWSCFDPKVNFLSWESKLDSPEAAEVYHKMKDGEIAWDLGTPSHPGPSMRHMMFGLYYSDENLFTADKWDKGRTDLVGCACIRDWEWEQWADSHDIPDDLDEDADVFQEEYVLNRLCREVTALNVWYVRWKARQEKEQQNPSSSHIELFDLYHIWRSLVALKREISSGAEVYDTVKDVYAALDELADTVLLQMTGKLDGEDIIPEEFIIDQIQKK